MINFRPITKNDFADLCSVLQDKNVMYAWEHAFSDEEVHKWIENCQKSYAENGFGYLYATESETGKFIGMMGLLLETVNGQNYIGLGYILAPKYWKKGYATQGAAIAKPCFSGIGRSARHSRNPAGKYCFPPSSRKVGHEMHRRIS